MLKKNMWQYSQMDNVGDTTALRKRKIDDMFLFSFILGLNFIFLCVLDMVMLDNEFETKENKI